MSTSGFLILLISVMSCWAAPNLENDHCQKPEPINRAQLQGEWNEKTYPPGKVANFACLPEYTQDGPIKMACIEGTWFPVAKGQCKEKVCSSNHPVEKGRLVASKTEYKSGEEVDVECEKGYVLQIEPNKRRKCTLNGWYPDARCVIKTCDRPDIKHGYIVQDHHYPKDLGRHLYYRCENNFMPPEKTSWVRMHCTATGWNPEPKCLRKCSSIEAYLEIAILTNPQKEYLEGEKVKFECNNGYQTPDGKNFGERTCLPDGKFTPEKCSILGTCQPPPSVSNARILGETKTSYASGEIVTYSCNPGYIMQRRLTIEAVCENTHWINLPVCKKIVEQCGPPPVVQFGETRKIGKFFYRSGESVLYSCKDHYTLKGKRIVRCLNGVWDKAPVCLEPCIPKKKDMEENNIELTWSDDDPISSKQGDSIDFMCKSGYEAPPDTEMSSVCEHGKLEYPKCFKRGFCVLQQQTMTTNNIHYNISPVVDHGQTITFHCNEGMIPEDKLEAKCEWRKINYPKCTANPCIVKEEVMEENNIQLRWRHMKLNIKQGDIVGFACKSGYKAPPDAEMIIVCEQGKLEYPKCFKREQCIPKEKDMEENNIQLRWSDYDLVSSEQSDSIDFKCKSGYEAPPDTEMRSVCKQGKLEYPKCFKRGSCVLEQQTMTTNNIQYNIKPVVDHGETITFQCKEGMMPEDKLEAKCGRRKISYPKCTAAKIGEQCGPPPVVQFGDTRDFAKKSYKSGESVEYRCPDYYTLKGNKIVRCLNGVWDEAPVCLEPCTVKVKDMEENNIQLRWRHDEKLYSVHGDSIDFICKSGYEVLPDTRMRIVCEQGKLKYPKCFRKGFCVLQQPTMVANNIQYSVSAIVDNEQTITFQCNEGMMPEDKMEAKCEQSKINYPKCTAAKSCKTIEIINGFLRSEQQANYNSGSSVDFQCNEDYVISGPINVKCENSEWTDLPVCLSPCKISTEDLTKRNIRLLPSSDPKNILDSNHRHGTEISVICKSGFRRPNQAALKIECNDGKFRYPRCFSGKTCRINQDDLDKNNLELDDVHDNEAFYEEGEIIHFKCKNGFHRLEKSTGTCSEQTIIYPRCTESAV